MQLIIQKTRRIAFINQYYTRLALISLNDRVNLRLTTLFRKYCIYGKKQSRNAITSPENAKKIF